MNSKNLRLIGVLVVLVTLYFVVDFTGNKGKSKSTKSELVSLDTDAVTQININAKGKEVALDKKEGNWKIKLSDGQWVPATESSVNSALKALSEIKPARLASKKQEKWKDYQVDSSGTVVKIYEGSKLALDIVLGRFTMEGQRKYSTFVRLSEEEEVYNVKDFMSFSVPSEINSYRDKVLAKVERDSISQLQFNYPSDSSFVLSKQGDFWSIADEHADSTSVSKYLGTLSSLTSSKFYDEPFNTDGIKSTLVIDLIGGESVVIDAYQIDDEWILQSSENLFARYNDGNLFDKIFKSNQDFMTP